MNRISKKNFEGEDDQDVQRDMENEEAFSEQEGLQKNESTSLLKGWCFLPQIQYLKLH